MRISDWSSDVCSSDLEKTSGGIIIPDTAKEKPQEGEVVAVGPGARDDNGTLVELSVKAGDRILFGKWSGTEVKIDGEDLLIMKESDILGVIDNVVPLKQAACSTALTPRTFRSEERRYGKECVSTVRTSWSPD